MGFFDAFKKAANNLQKQVDRVDSADFKEMGNKLKTQFSTAMSNFGEVTKSGFESTQSAIKQGLNSPEAQGFIEQAGKRIEGAKPLAGAVVDSIKDMASDPETLKDMGVVNIGVGVLSGTLPLLIAKKVMEDPAVKGTFAELLPVDLDKIEGVEELRDISNSDLSKIMQNPSMLGVVQAVLDKPELQKLMKDKLSEMTKDEAGPESPALEGQEQNMPDVPPTDLPVMAK